MFENFETLSAIFIDKTYNGKSFTISAFDDMGGGLKTITIKDNVGLLGGMITGSEVIPYRDEKTLHNLFNIEEKEIEKTSEIEKEKSQIKSNAKNFKITDEILPDSLTPSQRLNKNLEAISMLNRIEKGQRELDITAQEVLAKYVGWGGLADVFDESKGGQWESARNF